jgi:hypothetical protein
MKRPAARYATIAAALLLAGGFAAYMGRGEWVARGRIRDLPPGKPARVLAGDCQGAVEDGTGRFHIPIHGPCDREPLVLTILVADHGTQSERVTRAAAQVGVEVTWRGAREVTALSGTVLSPEGRPLRGAEIHLAACPEAEQVPRAASDAYGRFVLGPLPVGCRAAPFTLLVYLDGREQQVIWRDQPWSVRIEVAPASHVEGLVRTAPGVYRLRLDRMTAPDSSAYLLAGGLFVPARRPAGEEGTLLTSGPPPVRGVAVVPAPLSREELAVRLRAFRDAGDEARLLLLSQLLQDSDLPGRLLLELYLLRAGAARAPGQARCAHLANQLRALERVRQIAPDNRRVTELLRMNRLDRATYCQGEGP